MIRRRRRPREIPFSFDSFLDIVANVVGIIIRLILVVWVGARSYSSIQATPKPETPVAEKPAERPLPADPLQDELAKDRQELAAAQKRLLDQLRQLGNLRQQREQTTQQFATLSSRRQQLEKTESALDRTVADAHNSAKSAVLSLTELRERRQKLEDELHELEKLPPLTKILRYRTPISRPVEADEFHFECRQERVTLVDLSAMIEEVRRGLQEKGKLLRDRWELSDATRPYGAFRMRYTIERERGTIDAVVAGAAPDPHGDYRCAITEAVVEPITPIRGETAEAALATGSAFRRLVDRIDPQFATVTFWVYPDSFGLFRQLRDYLYDRDITVAGRPLPDGVPITCSSRGSVSRGQ